MPVAPGGGVGGCVGLGVVRLLAHEVEDAPSDDAPLRVSFGQTSRRPLAPAHNRRVDHWRRYSGASPRLIEEPLVIEVVDQLRQSLALQYLKEPGLSLPQIARLLGYEGSTSFHRAFRRWTGHSPSLARNKRRLPRT